MRESRRPVHDGITASGCGPSVCSAVNIKNPVVNNEYLTLTGLLLLPGAMLTIDLQTPSATRPGNENNGTCLKFVGSFALRTFSGRERCQTKALNVAADPNAPSKLFSLNHYMLDEKVPIQEFW